MKEPKLPLTPEQHAIAKMLKERHGMPWPFAAIIAKDVTALTVVDGSLSLPLNHDGPRLRKRRTQRNFGRALDNEGQVLEEMRREYEATK